MEKIQDKLIQQFQNMDRAYEEYARSKGLTYLSLVVLEEIYEIGGGCTQKQISEDTHYPKQSINLVIKSFLQEELVELKENPQNRKNKHIKLTVKGKQLCDNVVLPLLQKEEQAFNEMGEANGKELIRLLELYGKLYCSNINGIT